MTMKYSFFEMVYPPEKWLLIDVLYWRAAKILPKRLYFDADDEGRDCVRALEEHMLEMGTIFEPDLLEPTTTARMDLPIDPNWYESFGDDEDGRIAQMLPNMVPKEEFALRLQDYLDLFKSELLVALRKGDLVAEAILIDRQANDKTNDEFWKAFDTKIASRRDIYFDAFEEVPPASWVSRRLDWQGGYLLTDAGTYISLRFDCDEVLEKYPPDTASTMNLNVYGDLFFNLVDEDVRPRSKSRRGRPKKHWEEVNVRIALVICERGHLPRKQDAFAQELCTWYEARFGKTIGLSTMKSHLKSYYGEQSFPKS